MDIHIRRRYTDDPDRVGFGRAARLAAFDNTSKMMRIGSFTHTLCQGCRIYKNTPSLDLHSIAWYLMPFARTAGLSFTRRAMELPLVPWANDVVALKPTKPQRTTDMITCARDRFEYTVFINKRDLSVRDLDFAQLSRLKIFKCPNVTPISV
jgi:hypothetical protein